MLNQFVFVAVVAVVKSAQQCTKPLSIPYGELRCGNNDSGDESVMNDGDMCLISCTDDATLFGASSAGIGKIQCDDGTVNQDGYCNCNECCDPIPVYDDASASVTCTQSNKKKSKCTVKCLAGYTLSGQREIKCNKETLVWASEWPRCEQDETTVPPTTTEITTTTTTTTTTTITSTTTTTTTTSTATTPFETTTSFDMTTATVRPDPGRVGIQATITGTDINLRWNPQPDGALQQIIYTDQFGSREELDLPSGSSSYTLSGLTPGFKYDIKMIITETDGNSFSASITSTVSNNSIGAQCMVCHSVEGNEHCNAAGLTCEARHDQVCQTVVRASNGLPARFEKRCKQKLACENEKAMFKSSGQCGGGARARNVDVCVYCCEGDFCNAEGEFSDTL